MNSKKAMLVHRQCPRHYLWPDHFYNFLALIHTCTNSYFSILYIYLQLFTKSKIRYKKSPSSMICQREFLLSVKKFCYKSSRPSSSRIFTCLPVLFR